MKKIIAALIVIFAPSLANAESQPQNRLDVQLAVGKYKYVEDSVNIEIGGNAYGLGVGYTSYLPSMLVEFDGELLHQRASTGVSEDPKVIEVYLGV